MKPKIAFLHLGGGFMIRSAAVIGVFDTDNCTSSRITREFLKKAEANGAVVDTSGGFPETFVLCGAWDGDKVYLTGIQSRTLRNKWNESSFEV